MTRIVFIAIAAACALFVGADAARAQTFCQSVRSCLIEDGRSNTFGVLACQQEMTACAAESLTCSADCRRAQNEARNLCDTFHQGRERFDVRRRNDCVRRVRNEARRCRRGCAR